MSEGEKTPQKEDIEDSMRHLRELLVGPTRQSVEELRNQIDSQNVDAETVGSLLPEAITRSAKSGTGLAKSLGPTISSAFEESIRRDPKKIADAVSPIMGPAIRRYIQQQIQSMVQTLNTAIEHSLSPKSLRWRFEAWKTGKPFAEVVLLHTLVYRIEQVMLMDPDTGVLMQSVSSNQSDRDADLVSSLLTAIQDFVRESFQHQTETGSNLQEIETNELKVWIQHGSQAVLAIAVRGEPPITLRQKIQSVLERIHVENSQLLLNFRGDTVPLEVLRPDLEELLESEFVGKSTVAKKQGFFASLVGSKSRTTRLLRWGIPILLFTLLVGWMWHRRRVDYQRYLADVLDVPPTATLSVENQWVKIEGTARQAWIDEVQNRFERLADRHELSLSVTPSDLDWVNFVERLRVEPGVTVVRTKRVGDEYAIYGYRDPYSVDPESILAHSPLRSRVEQHWDLIRSSDPRMIRNQLFANIAFPNNDRYRVTAHVEPDSPKVYIHGVATSDWIAELQRVIQFCQMDASVIDLELLFVEDDSE